MTTVHRRRNLIVIQNDYQSLQLTETEARAFLDELEANLELAEFLSPDEPIQIAEFEFPSASAERLCSELKAVVTGSVAAEVDWMREGY